MSLITIQRSETPTDEEDSSFSSSNDESNLNKSHNEDFFASKDSAVLQNHVGRRRSSIIQEGDTIESGLLKAVRLLRKEDSLCLIVSLEKVNSKLEGSRYFCVILSNGKQNTDEYLIVGIDIFFNKATIGFVLPICQDMSVALHGDGGFKLKYKEGEKLFKPSTVHALWSTVHLLNKACVIAHKHNYYIGGLSHTWIEYYQISSTPAQIAEWNRMLYADTIANSSLAPKSAIGEFVLGTYVDESVKNKDEIRKHLKEIMRNEDMNTVSVLFLREKLEKEVSFKLEDYRSFIAQEILIIYGQMDSASKILPYLYLGSTYNASNLDELLNNKITHILNVTKETENFFREKFIYKNVEVYDKEDTDLLNYFNDCYQFISIAKNKKSACLVHCQLGVSRSASVVISYLMKEFNYSRDKAIEVVKSQRECIRPNDGFMEQLKTYEGILKASGHRHNQQFQGDQRFQIKSVPNDLYQIFEKDCDLESVDDLNKNNRQRLVTSQYDQPQRNLSEEYFCNNNYCDLAEESSKIIPQGDLLTNIVKEDSGECLLDESESTSQQKNSEIARRQLRLKEDASWIKDAADRSGHDITMRGNDITMREQVCCSMYQENVSPENVGENTSTRECHSVEIEPGDEDIDRQSHRSVKELLTKYCRGDH